jgi:hypothetical protein
MSSIEQVKGGTVLWSRVYCMLGIVCLSPLRMLYTTSPFLRFYDLATCLPVVLTGPGWSSVIRIGFVTMTLPD